MTKSKRRHGTKAPGNRRPGSKSPNNGGSNAFQPLNMFFNSPRSNGYQSISNNDVISRNDSDDQHTAYFSRSPNPMSPQDVAINMDNNSSNNNHNHGTTNNGMMGYTSDIETASQSPVEGDVCFPTPNKREEGGIDFDALEEFISQEKKEIAESRRTDSTHTAASGMPRRRRLSTVDNGRRYSLYGDRMLNAADKIDTDLYRVSFYSTAEITTVHSRSISEIPEYNDHETLSSMLKKGCFWIDIHNPTDAEMRALAKAFHIHPLTIEDICMEEQREKCEVFLNYYFICFRSFDQDEFSTTYLQPSALYIIVLKEGVLTFHFKCMPHPHNVRKRIKQLKDYINVTPDWICYGLMDDITDSFAPLIRAIEFEVDSIDELVLILKESEQSDMLRRIGYCRKRMMGLLRLLSSKSDVVKTLVKRGEIAPADGTRPALSKEVALYLGDVQDHLISMVSSLNHYEKISSRSHSNYLAQISIEMTQTNNEINDVLSKLTALGSILVPMNLVTGAWGMNVQVPGQYQEDLTWFAGIITTILIFCVISTILMRYYNIV